MFNSPSVPAPSAPPLFPLPPSGASRASVIDPIKPTAALRSSRFSGHHQMEGREEEKNDQQRLRLLLNSWWEEAEPSRRDAEAVPLSSRCRRKIPGFYFNLKVSTSRNTTNVASFRVIVGLFRADPGTGCHEKEVDSNEYSSIRSEGVKTDCCLHGAPTGQVRNCNQREQSCLMAV